MKRPTKFLAGGIVAVAVIGSGVTFAVAQDGDDKEPSITDDALAAASVAALAYTGGGRVTGTEVGDEESYYEVEVTLEDGRQVDVQLDETFRVVGTDDDADGERRRPGRGLTPAAVRHPTRHVASRSEAAHLLLKMVVHRSSSRGRTGAAG